MFREDSLGIFRLFTLKTKWTPLSTPRVSIYLLNGINLAPQKSIINEDSGMKDELCLCGWRAVDQKDNDAGTDIQK